MKNEDCWLATTRKLLNDRPASLAIDKIAEDLGFSSAWLRMIAREKIDDPGVLKIQALNRYLKNCKKKG